MNIHRTSFQTIATFLLLFAVLAFAGPAWGAVNRIAPTGVVEIDHDVLQAAIDAAQDGDVIIMGAGTWKLGKPRVSLRSISLPRGSFVFDIQQFFGWGVPDFMGGNNLFAAEYIYVQDKKITLRGETDSYGNLLTVIEDANPFERTGYGRPLFGFSNWFLTSGADFAIVISSSSFSTEKTKLEKLRFRGQQYGLFAFGPIDIIDSAWEDCGVFPVTIVADDALVFPNYLLDSTDLSDPVLSRIDNASVENCDQWLHFDGSGAQITNGTFSFNNRGFFSVALEAFMSDWVVAFEGFVNASTGQPLFSTNWGAHVKLKGNAFFGDLAVDAYGRLTDAYGPVALYAFDGYGAHHVGHSYMSNTVFDFPYGGITANLSIGESGFMIQGNTIVRSTGRSIAIGADASRVVNNTLVDCRPARDTVAVSWAVPAIHVLYSDDVHVANNDFINSGLPKVTDTTILDAAVRLVSSSNSFVNENALPVPGGSTDDHIVDSYGSNNTIVNHTGTNPNRADVVELEQQLIDESRNARRSWGTGIGGQADSTE